MIVLLLTLNVSEGSSLNTGNANTETVQYRHLNTRQLYFALYKHCGCESGQHIREAG